MQPVSAPLKRRYCLKCGFHGETAETLCPQCRRRLRTYTETRISGLFQTFGGLLLLGLMGFIGNWMWNIVRQGEQTGQSRFTGTHEQLIMIFGIIGLVLVFGIISLITGLWQLIFGRRNKVFTWITAAFAVVMIAGAALIIWRF